MRTAVAAAAVRNPQYQLWVWHAACLATPIEDLVPLVDHVGNHQFACQGVQV
ncbi:hypothetical protein [Streptomyces decoyicus]